MHSNPALQCSYTPTQHDKNLTGFAQLYDTEDSSKHQKATCDEGTAISVSGGESHGENYAATLRQRSARSGACSVKLHEYLGERTGGDLGRAGEAAGCGGGEAPCGGGVRGGARGFGQRSQGEQT